jgi:CheY-like chemotaxis protein
MFKVLIADDDYEDRELLKMEIQRAIGQEEKDIRYYEAVSVKQAREILKNQLFDLLTLDIEFDKMNEGIDELPGIFEEYPTLNIIVVSGKLNKSEVSEQLFRFTKDNFLKSKRWARHFDVLDKKDDKTEALRRAYSFAFKQKGASDKVRDLFLLAESYLGKEELDKCLEVYQKIQTRISISSAEKYRLNRRWTSSGGARRWSRLSYWAITWKPGCGHLQEGRSGTPLRDFTTV